MPDNHHVVHLTVVGSEHCRRARELKRRLSVAARCLGLTIEVEEASDILDPLRFALLGLPGLLIEGEFVMAGRVPSEKELTGLLRQHTNAAAGGKKR